MGSTQNYMVSGNHINIRLSILSMRYFFLILILFGLLACQASQPGLISLNGYTMGTTYSIKIISVQNKINVSVLQKDIETILADINQTMSTYIDDSELSILNQTRSTGWQTLSPDLYNIIKHADAVSRMTNGAFDVTIGPLVNIWGFGPDLFTQTIPADKTIESLKQAIGYEHILFNNELEQITKKKADLYIDLSGIAKGFAVDKIAQYLEHNNLQHYLVEIGG